MSADGPTGHGRPGRRHFHSRSTLRTLKEIALLAKGIEPRIPSNRSRKVPYPYDKALYQTRHKVENLFAKFKDWRRIATRYDRCAHTFFSAICIAAAVIFWL